MCVFLSSPFAFVPALPAPRDVLFQHFTPFATPRKSPFCPLCDDKLSHAEISSRPGLLAYVIHLLSSLVFFANLCRAASQRPLGVFSDWSILQKRGVGSLRC